MSRRHNGEGTIGKRRDGRWFAALRTPTGRRYVYGATERECRAKLRALQKTIEAGRSLPDDRLTVATHLADWLAAQTPTIKPSSAVRYAEIVRRHLIPGLGAIRLAKLTPRQVQAFYAERQASGLSPRTVALVHVILHAALARAVRWDLVPQNVCERVDPPRAARHEAQTIPLAAVERLSAAYQEDRYGALYVLAVTMGLRLGELLALQWSDIDLEAGQLTVRRGARTLPGKGVVISETKSGKARPLSIPDPARAALKWQATQQYAEKSVAGAFWQASDRVFTTALGTIPDANNVRRRHYYPLLARLGVPRVKLHELRHTYATLMVAAGVPLKTVSEALGHAGIAITADIYSHVTSAHLRAAAETMSSMLRGNEDGYRSADPGRAGADV